MHDVLLTQVQLWRTYWLTHPARRAAAADGARRPVGPRARSVRWRVAALVLAGVAVSSNFATGWLCVAWAAVPLLILERGIVVSTFIARAGAVVSWGGALVVSFVVARLTLAVVDILGRPLRRRRLRADRRRPDARGRGPRRGLLLRALGRPGLVRGVAVGAILGLLAWGVAKWDQRSDWQHFVERGLETPAPRCPSPAACRQARRSSWTIRCCELDAPASTRLLCREQGSGLLFNRRTSLEYVRREAQFAPLAAGREVCTMMAAVTEGSHSRRSARSATPRASRPSARCAPSRRPAVPDLPGGRRAHATARWTFRPR
jgi:hypothetical protein